MLYKFFRIIKKYKLFLILIIYILYVFSAVKYLRSYESDMAGGQAWGYTAIFDNPFVTHIKNICNMGVSDYGPIGNFYMYIETFLSLFWDRIIIKTHVPFCDLSPSFVIIRKSILALIHFIFCIILYKKILINIKDERLKFYGFLIGLFNPVSLLIGPVWGQLDEVLAIISMISIYFIYRKNIIISSFFASIAFLFKIQGVLTIPILILGISLISYIENKRKFNILFISKLYRNISLAGFTFIIVYFAFALPFIIKEGQAIFENTFLNLRSYPFLHLHSFNLWLFLVGDIIIADDLILFGNITYHTIGIILFLLISTNILVLSFIKMKAYYPFYFFLEISTLIYGTFLIFMTEIHERYIAYMYFSYLIVFILKMILKRIKNFEYIILFYFSLLASLNLLYVLYKPEILNLLGNDFTSYLSRLASIVVIIIYLINIYLFKLDLKSNNYIN